MRAITRIIMGVATIASLLIAFSGQSQAQAVKMGFINDELIKTSYPEWARAQEQMDVEIKAWDNEATEKQTELQTLIEEYEKLKLMLNPDKKLDREAAIRVKREALDAFTRTVYGPGGSAERKQMELIQPLLDRVNTAIQVVAEEGNYDVVFTLQSGLGYIKPSYDLTEQVLTQLEKLEN